jgi:hypothetical protein
MKKGVALGAAVPLVRLYALATAGADNERDGLPPSNRLVHASHEL